MTVLVSCARACHVPSSSSAHAACFYDHCNDDLTLDYSIAAMSTRRRSRRTMVENQEQEEAVQVEEPDITQEPVQAGSRGRKRKRTRQQAEQEGQKDEQQVDDQPGTPPAAAVEPANQEASECTFCCEPVGQSGPHAAAALKCGHWYGKNCLETWLQHPKNRFCPLCRKKVKPSEITLLYNLPTVSTGDPALLQELEQKASKAESERQAEEQRRQAAERLAASKEKELELMKQRLREHEKKIAEDLAAMQHGAAQQPQQRHGHSLQAKSVQPSVKPYRSNNIKDFLGKVVGDDVSNSNRSSQVAANLSTCQGQQQQHQDRHTQRIADPGAKQIPQPSQQTQFPLPHQHNNHQPTLTVQPIASQTLGGGRCFDMLLTDGLPTVLAPQCSNHQHSLMVLRIAQDGSCYPRCIDLPSNVSTIRDIRIRHTDRVAALATEGMGVLLYDPAQPGQASHIMQDTPAWSCAWVEHDPHQLLVGSIKGGVRVFDIRNTCTALQHHSIPGCMPVHTVIPMQSTFGFGSEQSILAAASSGVWEVETTQQCSTPKHIATPAEGSTCESAVWHQRTQQLMVSWRSESIARHTVYQYNHSTYDDIVCSSFTVNRSLYGHTSLLYMTHSTLIEPAAANTVLLCSADEKTKTPMIWDVQSCAVVKKLQPHPKPVLQLVSASNGSETVVGSRCEASVIKLYRMHWQ